MLTYAVPPGSGAPPFFTAYLMIWWCPDAASVFRQPAQISSSLVRTRPTNINHDGHWGADIGASPSILKAEFLKIYEEECEGAVQAMWNASLHAVLNAHPEYRHRTASGAQGMRVALSLPPWPFSWNFGVHRDVEMAVASITSFFMNWVQNRFLGDMRLLPPRPLHISWER